MTTAENKHRGLSPTAARIAVGVPLVVLMLVGGAALAWGFPEYYSAGYWVICAIFLVLSGIALTWAIRWERRMQRGKLTQSRLSMNYLALTTCKFVAVAIFLLLLWKFKEGLQAKVAVLTAMVWYIVGLILETIAFTGLTKYYAEKAQTER